MCDPRWVYGLPVTTESLCEYAKEKAPDCFDDDDEINTSTLVIEKIGLHLRQILLAEVAIDIFDEEFETQIVIVLHEEYPDFSKFTPDDEEYIRKELGIKEKGKWYRYAGSFFLEDLDKYKKTIPGPIPSRSTNKESNSSSSDSDRFPSSKADGVSDVTG